MRSGYYIVTKDNVLTSASRRIRLRRGDWLVTDGAFVGRFDKERESDWLPLEWVKGTPVILDAVIEPVLNSVAVRIPISKLEAEFRKLMFVEPGEPVPDMPIPSLSQLGPYLKARRTLTASVYDRRS